MSFHFVAEAIHYNFSNISKKLIYCMKIRVDQNRIMPTNFCRSPVYFDEKIIYVKSRLNFDKEILM